LKREERVSDDKEEGESEAERREKGRRVSAITRRIGAEKRRKDINMVIKKNRVFTPLTTLLDFSSFAKPISSFLSFCCFCFQLVKGLPGYVCTQKNLKGLWRLEKVLRGKGLKRR